ncbi:PREDICTED: uncharacterized protein LOC106127208 [Papilio xuthus]|uniref:Uncharacterized protein LOC106127208 n=1 Tax=Papilio xuthus TaxID=66420 RepID=A0AAJ6ZX79_PAPXU|nr:PREDICTED: uncharacterized protein LOC106127208 [Papilio xuthus]
MHAHTLTNMSPRCSLRCFALSVVLLLAVVYTEVSAFAIRSSFNTTRTPALDLAVDESLQLEVRHDFKTPYNLKANTSNKNNEVPASTTDLPHSSNASATAFIEMTTTIKYNPDVIAETVSNNMTAKNNISERSVLKENSTLYLYTNTTKATIVSEVVTITENYTTRNYLELSGSTQQPADTDNSMSLSVENINVRALNDTFDDLSTALNDTVEQIAAKDQLALKYAQNVNTLAEKNISLLPIVNSSDYDDITTNFTSRRKYTVIDRIMKISKNETTAPTDKYENKAESLVTLTSATSEEVLRRVATEYPTVTTPMPRLDVVSGTTSYPDILVTQEIENITNSFEVSIQKPKFESVSSKRAGFLNYSSKSKQNESTIENITTESAYRDHTTIAIENNFETFTGRNVAGVSKSQSYLDEDAIKEEMLQETSLKNNEEMAQQNRDGRINDTDTTFSFLEQFGFFTSTQDLEGTVQTNTEEIINTKPSQDKGKSTIVYTVSPNYKPMKKLEIQPPKQFVRDPDDNSWRNESISSLGIVFKPKNSSKPFTQVLKNKTETEWSNLLSRDNKSDVPDLRERLEKIAQRRKTKKKKTDFFGNVIYSDYEETNSSEEVTNTRNIDITNTVESILEDTTILNVLTETVKELSTLTLTTTPTTSTSTTSATTAAAAVPDTTHSKISGNNTSPATTTQIKVSSKLLNRTKEIVAKKGKYNSSVTDKERKNFNVFDYYDISNEDESEYLQMAKLELKKYSVPTYLTQRPFVTPPPLPYRLTKPETQSMPERKATIQYFPPRINTQQPKPNRFDNDVKVKTKSHTKLSSPKEVTSFTLTNAPDTPLGKYSSRYHEEQHHGHPPLVNTMTPSETPNAYNAQDYTRYLLHTEPPRIPTEQGTRSRAYEHTEGFHRASYVMKNYKDFIEQAAKDYDYERDAGLMTYTPPPAPVRGVTISDLLAQERDRPNANFNEDYDAKFRKDVLQRFVDNFNHNDARYRANFPVLYNNTVMHATAAGTGEAAAASRAFLKGLYSPVKARAGYARREPYDPACDNVTVELSPAYELHYYVPEQEEKEEIDSKPVS